VQSRLISLTDLPLGLAEIDQCIPLYTEQSDILECLFVKARILNALTPSSPEHSNIAIQTLLSAEPLVDESTLVDFRLLKAQTQACQAASLSRFESYADIIHEFQGVIALDPSRVEAYTDLADFAVDAAQSRTDAAAAGQHDLLQLAIESYTSAYGICEDDGIGGSLVI
jgi:hypothetical protein